MKHDSCTTTIPADIVPEAAEFTCARCSTPEHLVIESLHALEPAVDGWVMVDYSCSDCGSFYAHEVSVNCLTEFISGVEAPLGVVEVGQQYVHCGEPMQEGDMNLTGIADTASTDAPIPDVQLPTVVLRCRCGFQMSIPR